MKNATSLESKTELFLKMCEVGSRQLEVFSILQEHLVVASENPNSWYHRWKYKHDLYSPTLNMNFESSHFCWWFMIQEMVLENG